MSGDVLLSDEYMWNASNATVLWVAEFLLGCDAIVTSAVREEWREQIDACYGGILSVKNLPEHDRVQALKALRDDLLPALVPDEWDALALGRFRLLSLMAADVLEPRQWTPRSSSRQSS